MLVVDRHNYHLFQPLLYQVASGLLDPAEIAHPVRTILRGHPNTDVRMDEVRGIDLQGRVVRCGTDIGYDFLIVAAGAVTNHFGNAEIATHTWDSRAQGRAGAAGCSPRAVRARCRVHR